MTATTKLRTSLALACLLGTSMAAFPACARPEPPGSAEPAAGGPRVAPSARPAPGASLGIASVPNLRDVGGYATRDGSTVAAGLVYRSNQLAGISAGDMEKLAGLGLKVDYDLRTSDERNARPDEVPPGVT